jgi:pentose-5-phosphate-3-epimerase
VKPIVVAPSILAADPWIEADGGQNGDTAALAVEAGADAIVAGSAIFGSRDHAAAIARIRNGTSRKALAG